MGPGVHTRRGHLFPDSSRGRPGIGWGIRGDNNWCRRGWNRDPLHGLELAEVHPPVERAIGELREDDAASRGREGHMGRREHDHAEDVKYDGPSPCLALEAEVTRHP